MGFLDELVSALVGGAVKQVTQPQKKGMKLHGMNVVNGGGRSNINRPELLQKRQPMQHAQQQPMYNLDEYQLDQATGGRFQGGLRNMQPQSYPVQQLYRTPVGQTPTARLQGGMYGGYIQNGGIPTYGGNIFEDANGQEMFTRDYRNRLRVR